MSTLLELLAGYWWLLLIFGGTIIGVIGALLEGVRDFALALLTLRHERRLEIERVRAGRPLEEARSGERATPGPCPHRPWNIKPVFSALGDHTAWLCTACDDQLPKNWAVLEDDL